MTGAELKAVRESMLFSKTQLAAALDVSRAQVRHWENGRYPIRMNGGRACPVPRTVELACERLLDRMMGIGLSWREHLWRRSRGRRPGPGTVAGPVVSYADIDAGLKEQEREEETRMSEVARAVLARGLVLDGSCRCIALPGECCPLTSDQCRARSLAFQLLRP